MKFAIRRLCPALVILLLVLVLLTSSMFVYAGQGVPPAEPASENAVVSAASLHNPAFDNHIWYWFHERHGYATNLTPDALVPDDDTANGRQQWWLWYYHGTVPILTWATELKHGGNRAVRGRTYWGGKHRAGLYQIIYDTTPCLMYEFQMYGRSKANESDDVLHALQVGIDQVGNRPDTWAIHNFPSTMVWGTSHKYSDYGLLSVTAEAWADKITVYTYAEADGGVSHEILWDTGSFREVTQEVMTDLISDPDNPPAAGGISSLTVTPGSTSATVNWNTSSASLGQVYYRRLYDPYTPVVPPGTLLPRAVYVPLVAASYMPQPWLSTALDVSPSTTHSQVLTGLQPDSIYEYIVASRGPSGAQCVTWVSDKRMFTTAAGQ